MSILFMCSSNSNRIAVDCRTASAKEASLAVSSGAACEPVIRSAVSGRVMSLRSTATVAVVLALVLPDVRVAAAQSNPTDEQRRALLAKPSVVRVYGGYVGRYRFGGDEFPVEIGGMGSGFFISATGYIATNAHVVAAVMGSDDDAKRRLADEMRRGLSTRLDPYTIQSVLYAVKLVDLKRVAFVVLSDGTKLNYEVVASGTAGGGDDCAILKVKVDNAPALAIADSKMVMAADPVTVIGYPGAADLTDARLLDEKSLLEPTITSGVISALKHAESGESILQISADIAHGSSGGPAVDHDGAVIGLATFASQEAQGFNFLVASQALLALMDKAHVKVEPSETTREWQEALTAFWDQEYTASIAKLEDVLRLYPAHTDAQQLMKLALQYRQDGKERGHPGKTIVIVVGALASVLVFGLAFAVMRRKQSRALVVSSAVAAPAPARAKPMAVIVEDAEPSAWTGGPRHIPATFSSYLDARAARSGRRPLAMFAIPIAIVAGGVAIAVWRPWTTKERQPASEMALPAGSGAAAGATVTSAPLGETGSSAPTASADKMTADTVRQMFATQSAAVTANRSGLADSFADDALAFFPHAVTPVEGGPKIADAIGAALDNPTKVTWSPPTVGISGSLAWATATWRLTNSSGASTAVRVSEILEQHVGSPPRVVVASFSIAPLAADVIYYGQPPKLANGSDPAVEPQAWLSSPGELARHLRADEATVVVGSDANELAIGGAAAGKLLRSWRNVQLDFVGDARVIDGPGYKVVLAFAEWRGSKPTLFRVLALFVPGGATASGFQWELATAHYSVAIQPSGAPSPTATSARGPRCTLVSLACDHYSSQGRSGRPLHALAFAAEQAGRHEEALCLASPNLNSSDTWLAGAANFDSSRAWEGLGCHEQALSAIETSLAVRPRDQGGWNETCEWCRKIGGTCAACSPTAHTPQTGTAPVDPYANTAVDAGLADPFDDKTRGP
jgi:S1-C subfamily serine protease/ketosteroid isomerase-like protein